MSEILNEVPPPPKEELRGDPRDKLTFSTEADSTTTTSSSSVVASGEEKIENVITKSSDSDESKEPLRNRAAASASEDYGDRLRSSPPPLELAKKPTLPFIVIQTSEQISGDEIMWESRGTAQVSLSPQSN